ETLTAAPPRNPIDRGYSLRRATTNAARALRLPAAGRIAIGSPADLIVVPVLKQDPAEALLASSRRDLTLVVVGGRPIAGSPVLRAVFSARRVRVRSITLDGVERILDAELASVMAKCGIEEPGVVCLPDGAAACA